MTSLLLQVIDPDGVAKDGEPIRVEKKVALVSKMFTKMIEWKADKDGPAKFYNFDKKTLMKVLEWMEYHQDDSLVVTTTPIDRPGTPTGSISSWDEQFMDINRNDIIAITTVNECKMYSLGAADYLDIPNLSELCIQTLVSMIKGKTAEEIRKNFGFVNDFHPDEERQIIMDHSLLQIVDCRSGQEEDIIYSNLISKCRNQRTLG